MEEALKHIDLIDKYLTNTMNLEEEKEVLHLLKEDASFAKEMVVYKKIYEGMEAQNKAALKKRLHSYYQAYEKEQKSNPKGVYRRLYIGVSIAACLLLGLFLYNEFKGSEVFSGNPNKGTVGTDSTKVIQKDSLQKTPTELVNEDALEKQISKDTLANQAQFEEEIQLALGGLKRLPVTSVRSLGLDLLFYTFEDDKLTLYGNPLISGLQFDIFKSDGKYVLLYNGTYYSLAKAPKRTKLIPIGPKEDSNTWETLVLEEEIKVKIASVSEIQSTPLDLIVFYKEEKSFPSYLFEERSGERFLTISGNIDFENMLVYQIKRAGVTAYFVQSGKKIFVLDAAASALSPLKEVNVMQNRDARLFMEKDTLIKRVYQVQ